MKICVITPKNFPVPALKGGAVETLITNFIDENEKKQKVDVDVITIYDKNAIALREKYLHTNFVTFKFATGILFEILNCFKFNSNSFGARIINKLKALLYEDRIANFLKKNEYDFVITEGGHYWEYKKIYKYVPKEKSVFHIHNLVESDVFLDANYENFFCISKFIKERFIGNKDSFYQRVHLLYNGIKIEDFNKEMTLYEKEKIKKKYGLKNEEKVIIFCGRLVEGKGVRELILAFQKIYEKCNAKLLIVGSPNFSIEADTEYKQELAEISNRLSNNIIFTGHVYNKELYKLYNIADIAVFPHNCEEAFGLTLLEAMASGVPIITTNDGGIPEVTEGTETIILNKTSQHLVDDIANSILRTINNKELLEMMSIKGKQKAEMFSSESYYENFIKILNKLKN